MLSFDNINLITDNKRKTNNNFYSLVKIVLISPYEFHSYMTAFNGGLTISDSEVTDFSKNLYGTKTHYEC